MEFGRRGGGAWGSSAVAVVVKLPLLEAAEEEWECGHRGGWLARRGDGGGILPSLIFHAASSSWYAAFPPEDDQYLQIRPSWGL